MIAKHTTHITSKVSKIQPGMTGCYNLWAERQIEVDTQSVDNVSML